MKPLILSFFAVLLGYSLFFDKDEEVKLRNFEQVSPDMQSIVRPHANDTVTLYAKRLVATPEIIQHAINPDESFFMK